VRIASCEAHVRLLLPHVFFHLSSYYHHGHSPTPKRRGTGHKLAPMVEGSDSSLDTAIYIRSKEGERVLVPVRSHVSAQPTVEPGPEPEPKPDPYLTHDAQQSADIDMDSGSHNTQRKNRCFYMKQFAE